jgi:drug/metabolite transporter (DMT)-like permease
MGLAGLLLCGAGAAFERPDLSAITGESLTALLYLGTVASVAGFLAYFQLLRRLGPVPLSLVFVFFPIVAQVVAVLAGERPMGGVSLALLGLVLTASLVALTGASRPLHPRTSRRPSRAGAVAEPAAA